MRREERERSLAALAFSSGTYVMLRPLRRAISALIACQPSSMLSVHAM